MNLSKLSIGDSVFGVPFYQVNVPGLESRREELVQSILEMSEAEEGIKRSNSGGRHSAYDLHTSEKPEFKWIAEALDQVAGNCIKHERKGAKKKQLSSRIKSL